MVEKKLDFSKPILSVRRKTPSQIVDRRRTANSLPPTMQWLRPYGPELKSGPVGNSGSVPFLWEQSPGQPKEEILTQCRNPEGHTLRTSTRFANKTCKDTSEQSPGQPKEEILAQCRIPEGNSLRSSTQFANETSKDISEQSSSSAFEDFSREANAEQEREERREVLNQDRPVELHCRPKFDMCTLRGNDEEDETSGVNEHDRNVITICCLLPRSRLRSAICHLNPVPTMSVMNRVMTFPGTRMVPTTSLSSSSTDNENEYKEHSPRKQSFKTLQELLSDDGMLTELNSRGLIEAEKKVEDDREKIEETDVAEDSDHESSGDEDMIRRAINIAAQKAKAKLSRAKTLGEFGVATPPLPESPSDSWLFRAVLAKKTTSSASVASFSNK